MRRFLALALVLVLCLTGCNAGISKESATTAMTGYKQISQDEAKDMMARDDGHIIVDVRRQDEYDAGHIPGAILIPNESIDKECPKELPDLGRRSKEASEKLAKTGYTNIYEFGGIITWPGETTN